MGVRIIVALTIGLGVPSQAATPTTSAPVCQPAPVVVPRPGMAANSTYTSSSEPPARFLKAMPKGFVKIRLGRGAIDELCGNPPCNMKFLGCVRGDVIVVPDPSDPDFAKIVRHEVAHFNGWPDTHGD